MSAETWDAVDRYLSDVLLPPDPVLEQVQSRSRESGLPAISVAPNQGRLLELLARLVGARRILEIGTLGGYSAIWLARALPPGGRLTTLEYEPRHAEVARANLRLAGVEDRVDIRVGAALQTLPQLEAEEQGPFDLAFVDADKQNAPAYVEWAIRLGRPGSVIVVDNVVRDGRVLDSSGSDPDVEGVRGALRLLGTDPRLRSTAIQTVGQKGYDGLAIGVIAAG